MHSIRIRKRVRAGNVARTVCAVPAVKRNHSSGMTSREISGSVRTQHTARSIGMCTKNALPNHFRAKRFARIVARTSITMLNFCYGGVKIVNVSTHTKTCVANIHRERWSQNESKKQHPRLSTHTFQPKNHHLGDFELVPV